MSYFCRHNQIVNDCSHGCATPAVQQARDIRAIRIALLGEVPDAPEPQRPNPTEVSRGASLVASLVVSSALVAVVILVVWVIR